MTSGKVGKYMAENEKKGIVQTPGIGLALSDQVRAFLPVATADLHSAVEQAFHLQVLRLPA